MRFFIDENSHRQIGLLLQNIYPTHEYRTVEQEGLGGLDDVPLLNTLGSRGFDAIITADKRQLYRPAEHAALVASGLHWIGHNKSSAKGPSGVALTCSGVIAGFPFVLDHLANPVAGPTSFMLIGVSIEAKHRVNIKLL